MMPLSLSEISATITSALGNHLWQSTIFACGAALLTLSLRKNRAHARYWLWLAASLKFLIPFSLLVGIGNHLAWSHQAATPKRDLYFAMQQASEPFTASVMFQAAPAAPSAALPVLLLALLAVWVTGFIVVVFVWSVRWRRVSASIREAAPLREGCEVNTLRRLEQAASSKKPIQMLASPTSLEPGIFGIVRPVLIWPRSISERLDNAHLEAILAHELCHIRRRDNLAAAIHMFVEAVFWFHPMVWWLGSRLPDERERACDEEVLYSGRDRQVYAESILRICEFCVGSPLPCVAAVTGADLKRRIARIMSEQISRKLDFSRKLLLCAAIILAVTAPIVGGALHLTPNPFSSQTQNTIAAAPAYTTVSIAGMGPLLFHLSRQLHHTVLDETGLTGTYDFTLNFPDGVPLGIDNPAPPESYARAVSAAIDQQLGLKLELKKVPLEILVIDHVEKPLGN